MLPTPIYYQGHNMIANKKQKKIKKKQKNKKNKKNKKKTKARCIYKSFFIDAEN